MLYERLKGVHSFSLAPPNFTFSVIFVAWAGLDATGTVWDAIIYSSVLFGEVFNHLLTLPKLYIDF